MPKMARCPEWAEERFHQLFIIIIPKNCRNLLFFEYVGHVTVTASGCTLQIR